MDAAACWTLPDEPVGWTTPTPSAGGSGGDEAAHDECDGAADGATGASGEAAGPTAVTVHTEPTAADETGAGGFVLSLLAASPAPSPAPLPLPPPTDAALVPSMRGPVAKAPTAPRSKPAGGGGGAAGALARGVPVRQSAAVALARDAEYKDVVREIKKSSRGVVEITRDDLASCFHMPSELACRKLGIGLTVLKRQCRRFGIKRWPFRKIKSLDRLINNVSQGIVPNESGRVPLKSVEQLEEQKRQMEDCAIDDLDDETKRLQQAYSKASHKMRRLQVPVPVQPRSRPRAPLATARRSSMDGSQPRFGSASGGAEDEYSDEEEEEEEDEEDAGGWLGVAEEGDPNKRRRKPNPRYLDPPSKRVKQKTPRLSLGGMKGPRSLAALDADLLASLAEVAADEEVAAGGEGGGEDAGADGGDAETGAAGLTAFMTAPKPPRRVNLEIVREALMEHATGVASAIELAYGAEATVTISSVLDEENKRLHNRIVGLLKLSHVL